MKSTCIGLLLLCLFLFTGKLSGQSPCAAPPSCIINNELGAPQVWGMMNSSAANTVNGWYVSHGTPDIYINDCPTSSNARSIWMWSSYGSGEGVFTCYDFQQGQTYTLCLWVQNTNAITNGGHLQVWMVNNFSPNQNGSSLPPASITGGQLIDSAHTNSASWTQLSFTFTPNQNYNELLIYPYMANYPVGDAYRLQIDDVRVSSGALSNTNLAISASTLPGSWCDSTQLCINGLPSGAAVSWLPAPAFNDTTGACVYAHACGNTPIQAIVTGAGTCPAACLGFNAVDTLTYLLTVSGPQVVVVAMPFICGEPATLVAQSLDACDPYYSWITPDGSTSPGDTLVIPNFTGTPNTGYSIMATSSSAECIVPVSLENLVSQDDVYIPNTFTPNGDGYNPIFTAYSGGFTTFHMRIFSRWGEEIFETNDPVSGWDGSYKGAIVQEDTYVYMIDCVPECSGHRLHKIGHINVIR